MTTRSTRRYRAAGTWGALALLILLAVPAASAAVVIHPPQAPNAPGSETGSTSGPGTFVHPPAMGQGAPARAPGPAQSEVWYTQEGATLAEFNSSASQTGVKSLSVDIPLVNSPYPIGYELNGLSNRGDWYQAVLGVNWAGCPGLDMITEVWDNAQNSGPVGCSTAMTMSVGDLIRLGLNFSASVGVCMDFTDVSRSETTSLCAAQPNTGATEFVVLPGASDTNGYFTGPMTEIANTTASSCPDYTHMPLVNYEWPSAFGVSEYVPWSDEFELISGTSCYSGGSGGVTFASGDPSTNYFDTASGTGYGPHYVAGQVFSYVNPKYGFRIQTDPVPITSVTLTASAPVIPTSTNVTLNASVTGGASPYTALWVLNGAIFANGSLSRNWTGTIAGTYRFQVYGVDKHLDVAGPSPTVTVLVNGPLAVSSIITNLATGNADVGQTITFGVAASGGIPPYTYQWFGLPTECPAADTPTIVCDPAIPGVYLIHVNVTDTNASEVDSGTRPFTASPAPSPQIVASVTRLDLGQSVGFVSDVTGGAGILSYTWAGLPPGCVPVDSPSVTCTPTIADLYTVSVAVTDANGVTVPTAGLAVQVFSAPSVGLQVNRPVADAHVAVTFTVTPTGGSGGFTISWAGLPQGCVGSDVILLVCVPAVGGTSSVTVQLTDSVGGTATSSPVVLFDYAPLNLTVVGPAIVTVGNVLNASANVSGGAPGVSYQWTGLPQGCNAPASAQLTCQPASAGDYNITVTVTDGGGGESSVTYHLAVVYPSAGPSGTQGLPLLLLLGIAIVAVALVVVVGLARRRAPPS